MLKQRYGIKYRCYLLLVCTELLRCGFLICVCRIIRPDGFIEGATTQNLPTAAPHGRNQLLVDALKRVGLRN